MNKGENEKLFKLIEQLENKARSSYRSNCRMPSIIKIHEGLNLLKIDHWWWQTTNIVTSRSAGRTYVNSRHEGKKGYEIKITLSDEERKLFNNEIYFIHLDTSDSYYSLNAARYAGQLVTLLKSKLNEPREKE